MDADTKQKIESWLETKLNLAGVQVGCMQPLATWRYGDDDLAELQPKIGNYFAFSVSGIITEEAILEAYNADQKAGQ
jgi:hypothetical protein